MILDNFQIVVALILVSEIPDPKRRGPVLNAAALEDTLLYFTSFKDVSHWARAYKTCRPLFEDRVGTLSPINLPAWEEAEREPNGTRALHIFNHKPSFGYQVSFYFPRDKDCADGGVGPHECKIMKSHGLIQAVVLDVRRNTKYQKPFHARTRSEYVSIIGAGDVSERSFTEAVFLGSPGGSTNYRSTHTINGKRFPMEIYMYFEDPAFPGVFGSTQLVVLVESKTENNNIKPIIRAVHALRKQQKTFLDETYSLAEKEMAFREMNGLTLDKSHFIRPRTPRPKNKFWDFWFNEVSSEYERESEYYVAEYNFQRAKWLERKTEFLVDQLYNLNDELQKLTSEKALKYYFDFKSFHFEEFEDGCNARPANIQSFIERSLNLENAQRALNAFSHENEPDFYGNEDIQNQRKQLIKKIDEITNLFIKCVAPYVKPEDRLYWTLKAMNAIRRNSQYNPKIEQATLQIRQIFKEITDFFRTYGMEEKFSYPYKDSAISKLINEEIEPNLKRRRRQQQAQNMLRIQSGIFTEKDVDRLINKTKRVTVKVDHRFQISWLMPNSGGYYKYIGATPFPPCITVPTTIVFQQPIYMSKEQIEALSQIPNLDLHASRHERPIWDDITNTLPPLNFPPDDLKITFNRKNHQFRRNDEYHKSSGQKAKEKQQELNGARAICCNNVPLASLLLFLIFY